MEVDVLASFSECLRIRDVDVGEKKIKIMTLTIILTPQYSRMDGEI